MNNFIISFSHKDICTNILQKFINNDNSNKNLYFDNSQLNKYFINIKEQKYSELYSFLFKCTKIATNTLCNQNSFFILKLFSELNYEWNFCIFNNIMFNLPFTLDKIIFIPINYLNSSYKNNNYTKFSNTLVHEKIHIFQRLNLNKWNNIINLSFKNWILIKNNTQIYNFLKNYDFKKHNIIHIYNPDVTYDFLYLYNKDNKYYYGIFQMNNTKNSNGNISIMWFLLSNNNKYILEISNNENLPKEEHPFEMFAYKFSDYLLR